MLNKEGATSYETELLVYDINGDGKITALDLALMNAAASGKLSLW